MPTKPEGYRPHLDGLRAVAVYLVVVYHAGSGRFSGGFVGVDVFFVLSGYLVTAIIVRAGRGFRFLPFYARRVRRLLPAAIINLGVTAVVFAAIASPAETRNALGAMRAAALYVSNWYFIGESAEYFAREIDTSPVLQYWSLSLEEQFYLIWPLALGGLYWIGRRAGIATTTVVRAGIVLGGLVSVTAAVWIARTDPVRSYMGSDTRAYQLLAGAAVAISPAAIAWWSRRPTWVPRAMNVAALAILVAMATSLVDVSPVTRGIVVTAVMVTFLMTLEAADGGVAQRALSLEWMTYLGRVSYGTYLWHWIVLIVVLDAYEPAPAATFAIVALIATAIASLSYHLVEMPIRQSDWLDTRRGPVVAAGLLASLVLGLAFIPTVLDRTRAGGDLAVPSAAAGGTPNTADWVAADGDNYPFGECWQLSPVTCELVAGSGESVAIVGDSHATMLAPMLETAAARENLTLSSAFLTGCPWMLGISYGSGSDPCYEAQDVVFDSLLPSIDPDVVLLASRLVDGPTDPIDIADQDDGELDEPEGREAALRARMTDLVGRLTAEGRKVVMIEPIPVAPTATDPLECLSEEEYLEPCRFVAPADSSPQERVMRDLAAEDQDVYLLSLDQLVCPYLPICDPVVDGLVVRPDGDHITLTYSATLGDAFADLLVGSGALEAA